MSSTSGGIVDIVHVSLVHGGHGGVERYVREVCTRLAARGHKVSVISVGSKIERDESGVLVRSFPTTRKVLGRYSYQSGLLSALATASRRADVMHAHQPFTTP